ncbi:cytokinesis regulator [Metarhizium brunneum]
METLRLKPRQPVEDEIENWDDDDDLVLEGDELSFRTSLTTAAGPTNSRALSRPPSRRRDSTSSHVSFRSELESWHGEEKQLHLPADDESSTMDAIAAAEHAGIPLPKNVPSSALMGGTIKRLGGRKIRRIIQDDWENDLELPEASQSFSIKPKPDVEFPETLRQVSAGSVQTSPIRTMTRPSFPEPQRRLSAQSNTSALSSALNLDKFKDTEEDDDFLGDGIATIKVAKGRIAPQPVSFITPPTPQKSETAKETEDDFEKDLELPSDGKLKLSTRRDIPKTPSSNVDDLDWGEGSLGTRYGGTRRDGRSNRSSSASALSPSISSSITAESEDETFEGLVLPAGPFNFRERLQKRKKSFSPERIPEELPSPLPPAPKKPPTTQAEADREDFFEDLEIGDGNVFGPGKLTLHRNIKVKETQPASPARPKTAVSLTFTNKPTPTATTTTTQTRIPRLSHERAHSTSLEPVYESGSSAAPSRSSRRSQSRLGHSHQSSVVSLPTPTTTSPGRQFSLSTPRGREVGSRSSFSSLRGDAPTTSSQLLKQKRSLPAVRGSTTTAPKPVLQRSTTDRPPSRAETGRPQTGLRPKTPVERQRPGLVAESPASLTRKPQPFLPAGASQSQSQHVASKTLRQFRRHDSENAIDLRPISRAFSRSGGRSPSPHRYKVAADTWERLSKPKNKKHFGDGHELDAFDDLPTSRETETRFMKQPVASGTKTTIRNRLYQNILPDRTATPAPPSPFFPLKSAATPRFARDTAASRIARETSLAHRAPSHGPLSAITAQREGGGGGGSALTSRTTNVGHQPHLPQSTIRSKKKTKRPQQLKPHLIANLNAGKESKVVNGMFYNAETFRWEGNENVLNAFDATVATPSTTTASTHVTREREATTPRPALIANFSATKGVQVVGGMVFDPENMCWLRMGQQDKTKSDAGDTLDGFDALDDDEDVFKDIPDLDDNAAEEDRGEGGRVSDVKDDWLVGEEFDVGPEFVRRQREEEERWRKKCEKWVGRGPRDQEMWRWTIRELVSQFDELPM